MQMNLLRKVSLLEFRAASSSEAVRPTPSARIGFGRAGACAEGRSPEGRSPEATAKPTAGARAGHRRTTRIFKPVKNEEVVQRVNKILVGWGNYFQCGYPRKANI